MCTLMRCALYQPFVRPVNRAVVAGGVSGPARLYVLQPLLMHLSSSWPFVTVQMVELDATLENKQRCHSL